MDPRRIVRLDLGSISGAQAAAILAECAPAVDAEVARLRSALRHTQGVDEDDLRSLGQIACLEASLTWDASRGCALRTWAGRMVRWRLSEAVQAAQSPERGGIETSEEEGVDPHEDYDEAERLEWLQRALGGLTPRLRLLVASRLRGEAQGAVGRTLGIAKARTSQEVHAAVACLRVAAAGAGLVEE